MASHKEETLKQVGEVEGDSSSPLQSSTISKEKSAATTTTLTLLRSQSVGASSSSTTINVPLQRSRSTTRRTKTRKTIYLLSRKQPNDTTKDKKTAKAKANDISFSSTYQKSIGKSSLSSTKTSSISHKYKPKKFGDIAGNDITVTAISNAVEKKRIAPLYLFHGPRGTGKTSTARIFAMALNCESRSIAINKPCWSCPGCTRTLYIMDHLYSVSTRIAEFRKIQSVPGFKVLIIEDAEAYGELELLSIVQQGSLFDSNVVFVLISGAVNDMPISISSRCQKFWFPKLRDKDIAMKLEKITALEGMGIEREAMKLIVAKSEGSLREAENILDQLALLGSTITTSMVQQLVGLLPQNKLIDLLATAVSGETIKTVRVTKELMITGGVEPRALVSQLSSLITDILSGTSAVADSDSLSSKDKRLLRSRSRLDDNQTARLCSALKILVETERQLRSSSSTREDQTSGILAALIEIASQDIIFPRRSITLPSDDKANAESSPDIHSSTSRSRYTDGPAISASSTSQPTMEPGTTIKSFHEAQICKGKEAEKMPKWARMGDMEKIWQDMLEKIQSTSMKAFLSHQVRLASLSVSRGKETSQFLTKSPKAIAFFNLFNESSFFVFCTNNQKTANTIVHLMFKTPEDKRAAEVCEESISKALKIAIGCPGVTVNMSLEPVASSYLEEVKNTILLNQINPFSPQFGIGHSRSNTEDLVLLQSKEKTLMPTMTELKVQHIERCASKGKETLTKATAASRPECNTSAAEVSREILTRGRASIDVIDHNSSMRMMRSNNKPKHRGLSLSSILHIDASVEPYSQDILFENANRDTQSNGRKNPKKAHNKGFSSKPTTEDHHYSQDTAIHGQVNDSWRCIEILRHRRQKHES